MGFDEVEGEVGGDFAVGVEDVGEELLGGPGFDGAEVGADVVALAGEFVADHAGGFVDFGAAGGVAGHRHHGGILRDDLLAIRGRAAADKFGDALC